MTEEAEKLINTGEEEKDEVIGEKENVTNKELEMKTETHDLVVLGASGFTGNFYPRLKQNKIMLSYNLRPVCGPVCARGCERAWSIVGCGRFSPIKMFFFH